MSPTTFYACGSSAAACNWRRERREEFVELTLSKGVEW